MFKIAVCSFILLISCVAISARQVRRSEDTLELVHVIFRHGDRTPDKRVLYPNDPHVNETYYPVGFGQLTNAGKKKEYLLGKALRKRYGKFLGKYTIDTIDARCTDYNRTKMSLQLVLASLFPPEDDLIWEKRLKWQPVPFNYWNINEDHVLGDPAKNCPKYKLEKKSHLKSDEGGRMLSKHAKLLDYLEKHTGIRHITSKDFAELYFTLTTESENGLELPTWTKPVFPHTIKHLAILEYNISTATDDLRKLSSGFLLKKIIDDTRLKMKGSLPENRKMYLYSAHEFNIAFLHRFLGTFYDHVPPYGSCIIIEIHNVNGVRGVKLFYEAYEPGKPLRLKLPNCENFCRLEKFVQLYKNYLPKDDTACLIPN